MSVAANTPFVGLERARAASVTVPAHKGLNSSAVGAFPVVAMTIAASSPVLAIGIAAIATAPPIIMLIVNKLRHSVGGDRW